MRATDRTLRSVTYKPIGTVRSEHRDPERTPIQPTHARGCRGRLQIRPEVAAGLKDLDGFSHILLIYHLHKAGGPMLTVRPFMDEAERGVFATRHPRRPNAIGISVVRLVRIEGETLYVDDLDILDGTPLLDIKPFVRRFDTVGTSRDGWAGRVDERTARLRGRRGCRRSRSSDRR
ncbi:MAG: tRNA (N6-threonylcarbamoyladenosine(37)-N6)-methyltransferase TrmO [Acidobacteriota bacterium]